MSPILVLFPCFTHWTILRLSAVRSSSSLFAELPMLWCWTSRNNNGAEGWYQFKELTWDATTEYPFIYCFPFCFPFPQWNTWEKQPPMWRKAPLFQKLGGRHLPLSLPAWVVPLLTHCRSFHSPSTETRRRYRSRCATWHATWPCQTLKTGKQGIYLALRFGLFSIGVGEQELVMGSGHAQQPSEGEWWCLSHMVLGSAFELC